MLIFLKNEVFLPGKATVIQTSQRTSNLLIFTGQKYHDNSALSTWPRYLPYYYLNFSASLPLGAKTYKQLEKLVENHEQSSSKIATLASCLSSWKIGKYLQVITESLAGSIEHNCSAMSARDLDVSYPRIVCANFLTLCSTAVHRVELFQQFVFLFSPSVFFLSIQKNSE